MCYKTYYKNTYRQVNKLSTTKFSYVFQWVIRCKGLSFFLDNGGESGIQFACIDSFNALKLSDSLHNDKNIVWQIMMVNV